jgi:CubicO group peptidase (beta-lactamase class C family)
MGAQDFAKLGELMLKKGNWKGERLINEDYVEEAIRPGQEFDSSSGLLWWIDRSQHVEFSWIDRSWQHPEFAAETTSASEFDFRPTTEGVPTTYGFSARGYLGQYLLVLPEERLIAVRQIRSDRHKDESDSFPEFYELVRALIN